MHGGAGEGEEMIDTKALAERIHKAINWPGDKTLSELLDDELRPLLSELERLRSVNASVIDECTALRVLLRRRDDIGGAGARR